MEQPSEPRPPARARHALDDAPAPALPTSASAMNPVSRKLIAARYIAQTLWALVIAGSSLASQLLLGGSWWTGAVATGVWFVFQAIMIPLRVRNLGWLETGNELLISKGKMFQTFTVVPYGRIQFVDVTTGPFTRPLGLKGVTLHTASASTDAKIPGLEAAEADALRERLAVNARERMSGL
ncbi:MULTISPECIES: PH domain-containing protein [unclassified Corynebacterium]|uniref:PH domain-containing protein n=2 Tax=unclassified Corynebacterium TaxID=2624378 RepID=UPI0037C029FA